LTAKSTVRALHITNGDCAADTLRRIVDGAVTITADVLHEGRTPRVEGDAWYETRAGFLGSGGDVARQREIKDQLAASDRTIADAVRSGDRIVLWFEHDLFDQLLLIRTLDLIGGVEKPIADTGTVAPQVSLICIDTFPGVERFTGLGQLTADQLTTLIGTERQVSAEQYALATAAWNALRAPDPNALLQIAVRLDADTTDAALPFLGDALRRLFAEYPSTSNGLSRTEQLALDALARGPALGGDLFVETQRQEARPFMGDLSFFDIIRALAGARVPLVTIDGPGNELDVRRQTIAITDAGRDVAAGRRDHVALNGIDRWRGGVHLSGGDRSPWRWDARRETLIS
jgi:hypothetical protein